MWLLPFESKGISVGRKVWTPLGVVLKTHELVHVAPAERLGDHRKEQGSNEQASKGMKIMQHGLEGRKAGLAATHL